MRVTQAQVCSTDVKWRKLVVCESAVDTSNVAEEALEVVVIVVAKIKAVTLVDTDIMAHSLCARCQWPIHNSLTASILLW